MRDNREWKTWMAVEEFRMFNFKLLLHMDSLAQLFIYLFRKNLNLILI